MEHLTTFQAQFSALPLTYLLSSSTKPCGISSSDLHFHGVMSLEFIQILEVPMAMSIGTEIPTQEV